MTLQGFDKQFYLTEKLAALQQTDSAWIGKDIGYLESLLANTYGLTAESHYKMAGYLEGLAPNGYFNADEYSLAKATQLVNSGYTTNIDTALAAFKAACPGNPYDHYLQFGAAEGLNPSNAFDDSSYLVAKLASLQTGNPGLYNSWTITDLRTAFTAAGITSLGHFLTFGAAEGLIATVVPPAEQVSAGNGLTFTIAQALANSHLPDNYKINDTIANILTTKTAEMHLLGDATEINVNDPASVAQINTLTDDRGYTHLHKYSLLDTSANLRSVATGDIVEGAASIALSQGIAVAEYTATKALFAGKGQPFTYSLADTLNNLLLANSTVLNDADTYNLSNSAGSSFGLLSKTQYEFVQDAANYERGKWDFDTNTYLVGADHNTYPNSAIVYITAKFANGKSYSGSGVVVGKNDILTASHLVFSDADGGLATAVTVYPGRDGSDSPFGSYNAARVNYFDIDTNNDGLLSKDESESDLAVLGFTSAVGNKTGWFGLDPHQTSNYYNLSGYPGVYADSSGPRMTNDYGYAREDGYAAVFNYVNLSTNPGSSGGPLWYGEKSGPYAVAGIVSTGSWAVDVYAKYDTILAWLSGNDSLLPGATAALSSALLANESAPATTGEDIQLTGVVVPLPGDGGMVS